VLPDVEALLAQHLSLQDVLVDIALSRLMLKKLSYQLGNAANPTVLLHHLLPPQPRKSLPQSPTNYQSLFFYP
jgi:hypothetical protein